MNIRSCIKSVALQLNAAVRHSSEPQIVFYHDLTGSFKSQWSTPFELFRKHVRITKNAGWTYDEKNEPDGKKRLKVFFDDGFQGVWERREYFLAEGILPTVSVAVGLVGQPGFLTWEKIIELDRLGFGFVSHTWTHRTLTDVPESELTYELRDSRECLAQHLGHAVDELCFPRGKFSSKIIEESLRAGYAVGYSSVPGLANEPLIECGGALRLLPRTLVQYASPCDYLAILRGGMLPMRWHYLRRHFVGG